MIHDLALILIVASIVTLLFKKLKQPLVLGYIVAGFLVSPHMPYLASVVEEEGIHEWADIGVTFLLFSLGLDFSFKKILKMGAAPIIAAITIVACMLMLGYSVGMMFGWDYLDCVFLGGMLAMSSTTIIYKAFDDLGLRQQSFASLVMSVLILEDILAIVMMVMLSAIATGDQPGSEAMILSVIKIAFFLILWFVVGIFAVPLFLSKVRKLMNQETLVVNSIGLCCMMAVISTQSGFSSAFGAFVMGSIFAETIDAERIEKVTSSVKDLFGAVFFVSVGMLVDPEILIDYAGPILTLVVSIILGQAIFGTIGFFLSGQTLHTALRCGFSMAQIGEFAFIIASLGMSMHVIAPYLYPVVVAVSVITTFLTPYMIRAAEPVYHFIERRLPKGIIMQINSLTMRNASEADTEENPHDMTQRQMWNKMLRSMAINTVVYTILIIAITYIMLSYFLFVMRGILPHWWANGVTGIATVMALSPFMRAIVMKKNNSEEWRKLWEMSVLNRLPLLSTVVARAAICLFILFYICNYLARFANAIVICLALVVILIIVFSRAVKQRSIRIESMFINNLRSRDVAAQVKGSKLPTYASHLYERSLTLTEIVVPDNSRWMGKTLAELNLGKTFGIHVSSILRNGRRINIPYGKELIFSGDKLQVIGSDAQIKTMASAMAQDVYPEDDRDVMEREMLLRQIVLKKSSPFIGKTLRNSRIREEHALLVVGIEEGQQHLSNLNLDHVFEPGDIIWLVGERSSFENIGY